MEHPLDLVFELTPPVGPGVEILRARLDERIVGELAFNLTIGPAIWIHWLEVAPSDRRRGIASALRAEVARRFPWAEIDTGGLTREGVLFEAGKH